jgi:hypothetical protein
MNNRHHGAKGYLLRFKEASTVDMADIHRRGEDQTANSLKQGLDGLRKPRMTQTTKGFQFQDADIILMCSDGVTFRVHKSTLAKSSPVFDDMFMFGSEPPGQLGRRTDATKLEAFK